MRQFMYPIFSGKPGAYQMDTLVNANGIPPYFLILINVNTISNIQNKSFTNNQK